MTFHFINVKDEFLFLGKFLPFAFANAIAYCQVADSVHVSLSLFFLSLQPLTFFSEDSSYLITVDHRFAR